MFNDLCRKSNASLMVGKCPWCGLSVSSLKPQLSLKALLVLVTVSAMLTAGAVNWYLPKRYEAAARSRFELVELEKDAGVATLLEVARESEAYLEASLAVPFVDRQAMLERHRDLIWNLEQMSRLDCGSVGSEEHEQELKQLMARRNVVEKRLADEENR